MGLSPMFSVFQHPPGVDSGRFKEILCSPAGTQTKSPRQLTALWGRPPGLRGSPWTRCSAPR